MEVEEDRNARDVMRQILYNQRFLNDQKIDQIISYMNSTVKKYKINDRFDTISATKDRNIADCSRCLGCVFTPIRCCFTGAKFIFYFTLFIIIVSGTAYMIFS